MTSLQISNPDPADRETVYSYLSRLAATWRTGVADFAYDIGAPFKGFLEQDLNAFGALTHWAGLDMRQMEEMLSWTGVRAGNVRMKFRGELVLSRAVRNPAVRGCPVCLREDALQHDGPSTAAMVMRGDWLFREVNVCVRHNHPLITLWKSEDPRDRNDISARLGEIEEEILSGRLDQEQASPSMYDLWLDARLQDGRDETWLKSQSLFAATTFIRLLGQAIHQKDGLDHLPDKGAVHTAGFEVARRGETAIRQALDRIAKEATGHLDEPKKIFGLVYPTLNKDSLDDKDFDVFRSILRDCILDHWAIAPGDILMGEVVTERRLHSIVSAAREIGVGAQVLELHLIEMGAISKLDDRPRSRKMFDPRSHADLLAEIPSLVAALTLRRAMGASRREFESLIDEGVLVPRTRVAKLKHCWRLPDGTKLVEELQENVCEAAAGPNDWETLLLARQRSGLSLAVLIEAIRQNRLKVAQRAGVIGFHGIVVLKSAVDGLALADRVFDVSKEAELPGVMSAAEFGRQVGLRDHGAFVALIEAGYTPAERHTHPKTGRSQYRLSAEDISAFHRRFVTLPTLSLETRIHRNTLKKMLSAASVARFSPGEVDFGPVYLRCEAANALAFSRQSSPRYV